MVVKIRECLYIKHTSKNTESVSLCAWIERRVFIIQMRNDEMKEMGRQRRTVCSVTTKY